MKETIYTKPLRTPDERPSRITDSIKVTIDDDVVLKIEQLAPVAKVLNAGSIKPVKAELVQEPDFTSGPVYFAVYKITDENFLEWQTSSSVTNFVKLYISNNYTIKGISLIPYTLVTRSSAEDEDPVVQEGIKALRECIVDSGIITSPDVAGNVDTVLNKSLETFADGSNYTLIENAYFHLRCLDFEKLLNFAKEKGWLEDAKFTLIVNIMPVFFHMIGRTATKQDDPNLYFIVAFGVPIGPFVPITYTISYNSDYGPVPSGNVVDEGYVLTEADLPDMSEYRPEGYAFNGWEMDHPGSGNMASVGMTVWNDLQLYASFTTK